MSKDLKEVNEQTMPGAFQTGNSKEKALRLEFLKAGEPSVWRGWRWGVRGKRVRDTWWVDYYLALLSLS